MNNNTDEMKEDVIIQQPPTKRLRITTFPPPPTPTHSRTIIVRQSINISCESCNMYLSHAKWVSNETMLKMEYECHPNLFNDWTNIGNNRWFCPLVLSGNIILHNEKTHISINRTTYAIFYRTRLDPSSRSFGDDPWPDLESLKESMNELRRLRKDVQHSISYLPLTSGSSSESINNNTTPNFFVLPTENRVSLIFNNTPMICNDNMLLDGLFLPNEVRQRIMQHHAGNGWAVHPLRMHNVHYGVFWTGLLVCDNYKKYRFFKCDRKGTITHTSAKQVETRFIISDDNSWHMISVVHHPLLLADIDEQHVKKSTDLFHQYDPLLHDIVLKNDTTTDTYYKPVAHASFISSCLISMLLAARPEETQKVIPSSSSIMLPGIVFVKENKSKCFIFNLLGRKPTSMRITTFQQDEQQDLKCTRLAIRPKNTKIFPFYHMTLLCGPTGSSSRSGAEKNDITTHFQKDHFVEKLKDLVLSDWSLNDHDDDVYGFRNDDVNDDDPLAANDDVYGFHTLRFQEGRTSLELDTAIHNAFIEPLLHFVASSIDLAHRASILQMSIELLRCPAARLRFKGQFLELKAKKYPLNVEIMYHGVRAKNLETAVDDIKQFGFNAKYAENAVYGGGGTYCTPQAACALEYARTRQASPYYMFLCLTLPGIVKSNGKQNEAMAHDQHSWIQYCPPYEIYCTETNNIIPFALITII